LAAVSFPNELARISMGCFRGCNALVEVDLSRTCLSDLAAETFTASGVICVSLPATLNEFYVSAFDGTALTVVDLSVCRHVFVVGTFDGNVEVRELRLPRHDFAEYARILLPGSRVEVLDADIDADETKRLVKKLDKWGIDRLRIVSQNLEAPFEWRGVRKTHLVRVTNPKQLVTPSAVFATSWRMFDRRECEFLRSIDMSALPLAEFPQGATLSNSSSLESAILPAGLRVLPMSFFRSCWRLSDVGTSSCTALDGIAWGAFLGCRSLGKFVFPRTIREVDPEAFSGTAIAGVDLTETAAESVGFVHMIFLEQLVLHRRCVLKCEFGLPALRSLTFGQPWDGGDHGFGSRFGFGSGIREVRFEGFLGPPEGSVVGLENAHVHAEVAAVSTHESRPTSPP
jgi:hypothetical protein